MRVLRWRRVLAALFVSFACAEVDVQVVRLTGYLGARLAAVARRTRQRSSRSSFEASVANQSVPLLRAALDGSHPTHRVGFEAFGRRFELAVTAHTGIFAPHARFLSHGNGKDVVDVTEKVAATSYYHGRLGAPITTTTTTSATSGGGGAVVHGGQVQLVLDEEGMKLGSVKYVDMDGAAFHEFEFHQVGVGFHQVVVQGRRVVVSSSNTSHAHGREDSDAASNTGDSGAVIFAQQLSKLAQRGRFCNSTKPEYTPFEWPLEETAHAATHAAVRTTTVVQGSQGLGEEANKRALSETQEQQEESVRRRKDSSPDSVATEGSSSSSARHDEGHPRARGRREFMDFGDANSKEYSDSRVFSNSNECAIFLDVDLGFYEFWGKGPTKQDKVQCKVLVYVCVCVCVPCLCVCVPCVCVCGGGGYRSGVRCTHYFSRSRALSCSLSMRLSTRLCIYLCGVFSIRVRACL